MKSFGIFLCIICAVLLQESVGDSLKCLVCQKVVDYIFLAVENEDPTKKIQVGSFRIQPDGSQKKSEIKYAGSEIHIQEILEAVCGGLDDYAQAKHKESGALTLLNLSTDVDKLSTYDLLPDPDLNRGVKYHGVVEIEGFQFGGVYIIKEFSYCEITSGKFTTRIFKPPFPYEELNENSIFQTEWCESFIEDFEDDIVAEINKTKDFTIAKFNLCKTVSGNCKSFPHFDKEHNEL